MRAIALLLAAAAAAAAETSFEAVWKRGPLPDRPGVLLIGEQEITFRTAGKSQRERSWPYPDIQHFERISLAEIAIRSYEDSGWKLGRDRRYRFALRGAEIGDDLHRRIVSKIGKPATDRVARPPSIAELEIPVKRLTRSGGSQGTLYIGSDRIVYSSPHAEQSRTWVLDRDVHTVWSADPYRLEVHVYEGTERSVPHPRVYRFALKSRLDTEYYRGLKKRLYALGRER